MRVLIAMLNFTRLPTEYNTNLMFTKRFKPFTNVVAVILKINLVLNIGAILKHVKNENFKLFPVHQNCTDSKLEFYLCDFILEGETMRA